MTDGYTSGARRRNDLTALLEGTQITHVRSVAGVNEGHALAGRINTILDTFRDADYGHDAVFEWLFCLGYVWTEWQSPRLGAFPVENWSPGADDGPTTFAESERSGEDRGYWGIQGALRDYVARLDGITVTDYDDGTWGYNIDSGDLTMRRVQINEEIQDRIAHATAVLTRLLRTFEED